MTSSHYIELTAHDSDDREVLVGGYYYPALPPCFDRGFGTFLPGDPELFDVITAAAVDEGADVDEVLEDEDSLTELARMAVERE